MPSAYPSSAHNAKIEVELKGGSTWSDKDAYRLAQTNPSVGIDRINDNQAMYHEISYVQ
jgi:hypothetical protein